MNTNIFELATKQKLRFSTTRGNVGVEDLWDLTLEQLDDTARLINKKVKETSEESFINKRSTGDKAMQLRLDVVVSIINTKLEEESRRKNAAERKVKREAILKLMADKQDDALKRKSLASLQAELDKLEDDGEETN